MISLYFMLLCNAFYRIETSYLIGTANQLSGFYVTEIFALHELYTLYLDCFYTMNKAHQHCKKMKFTVMDFFSKCNEIRRKLRIWSHLVRKFSRENFIFLVMRQMKTQNFE